MAEEGTGVAAGMRSSRDAIALVRTYLADDRAEAARIFTSTPNPWVLAVNLGYMIGFLVRSLSSSTLEDYFALMRLAMQDSVLDVDLASIRLPEPWQSSRCGSDRAGTSHPDSEDDSGGPPSHPNAAGGGSCERPRLC
jgi:hypothetical protein